MKPVVPCPVVVGRAAELEALADAIAAACDGRGNMVFIAGEAGIGKSRLVHEVEAMAAARGARVLRGRAVPGASAVPFRPLAEALGAAVPQAGLAGGDLDPWLPALAAVVPALGPRDAAGAEVTAPVRGEAVVRFLQAVCAGSGGLLVLEDLHWADPETVAVVEHLSDNLARAPVLCAATVRAEEDGPARDLVRRVASRRTAPVLRLARLNGPQVAAMVHRCAGGTSADTVERVLALSEGVPFLVEEMLVSPGLPASFVEGVEQRFAQLPGPDRRLLATAAALGRHFDWRLLPAATGLPEPDVVDALDRGVAAQLLAVDGEGFRFRHALTAEAVFQSVIPPRREAFAAAALAALDGVHGELSGDLCDVVAGLAERTSQRGRAGRLYRASGEEALAQGALQTAVLALARAARLLEPGDGGDAARERLIEALAHLGRVDDALAAAAELAGRLPAARSAAVHLRLAGAATTAARWELAAAQLDAVRGLIRDDAAPALQAELAIREAELAIDTNDTARAEDRADAALRIARGGEMPALACAALQLLGRCHRRSSLERAQECFREAFAIADGHGLALWRLRALHEIGTIGLLDRGDLRALVEAQAMAESLGAVATAAMLDVELAAGYDGAHDVEREARHGQAAVHRGTGLGLSLVVAYGWLHMAGAAALRGDRDALEAAAAGARAAAPGNRDVEGLLVGACDVVVALLADEQPRALAAAARSAELLRGSDTAPPAHFRAVYPLLLAATDPPAAAVAVEELERAGVAVSRAGRGCLMMVRAVLAGPDAPTRALALAVEADGHLTRFPLWRCIARRFAAQAAAADGWAVPGGWLADAEQWFRDHGYPAPADACAALRRAAAGGVPPQWARLGVTPREAEVLELVIEGRSNREIAGALYLSVRTVEKHVESLLRKTSSRTRTQLARVATST